MKRPHKPPALSDFRTRRLFASTNSADWNLIRTWQQERLISVEAVTGQSAWVEITEAGKSAA